ncbi:MAG: hypothetical protein WAT93_11180 [Pontixanthobacter sp.]
MNKFCLPISVALIASLASTPAFGQTPIRKPSLQRATTATATPDLEVRAISPDAMRRLDPIKQRYDLQITQAFKDNPSLKAAMEADLKAVDQQKDPARKRQMIAAYQRKFGPQYQQLLAEGNVSLSAMARDFGSALPEINFSVSKGLTLIALPKAGASLGSATTQSTGTSSSLTRAPTEVRTITGPDYQFRRDGNCFAVSGSEVVHSGGYLKASATALEAGECFANGSLAYEFTVSEGQQVEVVLTYDLVSDSTSVGLLGFASSRASSGVTLLKGTIIGRTDDFPGSLSDILSCDSFAPLLMADARDCDVENARRTITITSPGNYVLRSRSNVFVLAGGVVAGTSGTGEVKKLRATLTFRPK